MCDGTIRSLHYIVTAEFAGERIFENRSIFGFGKIMGERRVPCFFYSRGKIYYWTWTYTNGLVVGSHCPSARYCIISTVAGCVILLSRVNIHSIQSAIFCYQFSPSVCSPVRPSVRPMAILCLNECIYRHTIWQSGRGITFVYFF